MPDRYTSLQKMLKQFARSAICIFIVSLIGFAFPSRAQQNYQPPYLISPEDGEIVHTSTPSLRWEGWESTDGLELEVDDSAAFVNPIYSTIIPPTLSSTSSIQQFTPSPTFGSNWTAEFYNNMSFSGTPVGRNVDAINFNWGEGPPGASYLDDLIPGIGADYFSVRFTGRQNLESGTEFVIVYDDFVRFLIDGAEVFSDITPDFLTAHVITVKLLPGQHILTFERVEITGNAVAQLQWFFVPSVELENDAVVLPQLADGTYFWRARWHISAQTSDWSEVRQFTIADATPDRNLFTSNPITLTWENMSGAALYHVQISRLGLEHWMTTGVIPEVVDMTPDTSLTLDLPEGRYNWRLQAKDQSGHWTNWSQLETFTVDLP